MFGMVDGKDKAIFALFSIAAYQFLMELKQTSIQHIQKGKARLNVMRTFSPMSLTLCMFSKPNSKCYKECVGS